jgi:hypothetical protein
MANTIHFRKPTEYIKYQRWTLMQIMDFGRQ